MVAIIMIVPADAGERPTTSVRKIMKYISPISHIKTEGFLTCIAEICIRTALAVMQEGKTWGTLRVKQKAGV
jgi:hypothetical protein